jgi:hypothetical protein
MLTSRELRIAPTFVSLLVDAAGVPLTLRAGAFVGLGAFPDPDAAADLAQLGEVRAGVARFELLEGHAPEARLRGWVVARPTDVELVLGAAGAALIFLDADVCARYAAALGLPEAPCPVSLFAR